MSLPQITLYVDGYFANAFDATCFVALEEKGVPFTTSRALLRYNQGFPKQFQTRVGISRIPALQHGDFWLTESMAIAEYLEDTFATGARLLPTDTRARARARQVMAWLRFDLRALRSERPWRATVYPTASKPLTEAGRRDVMELVELVDWLADDGALAEWNIAHVDLAFALMRIGKTDLELPLAARRHLDANLARPSVRAYLDHPRPPNPPP